MRTSAHYVLARLRTFAIQIGLCLSLSVPILADEAVAHPLDPLSADEIRFAVAALVEDGRVTPEARAHIVALVDPPKSDVLKWQPGDPTKRRALLVLRIKGQTYEAVVDLAKRSVESWQHIQTAQTPITSSEWALAEPTLKADTRWQAAMRRRGYDSFEGIFCESLSAGYFGPGNGADDRLLKMPCYDVSGARTNIYARPIEGVLGTVNLDRLEVTDVTDTGVVPVGNDAHNFDGDTVPTRAEHAQNGAISITGQRVAWGDWAFHLGYDQRFGPILSLVTFAADDARRMILYQGHVSEVFVPYMEADQTWAFRTYIDAGEYGLGTLASPLAVGVDCPADAHYLATTLATPSGGIDRREKTICVFEDTTTQPMWRHYEAYSDSYAGRAGKRLVVRSISSIAHYDYLFDWVFHPGGRIEFRIGATGIDAVQGSVLSSMSDAGAEQAAQYGTLVAPGLIAVHHDHFFSVRLDMDIDGPANRFVQERIVPKTLPETSLRRSLWQVERTPLSAERALRGSPGTSLWRVENPEVVTSLGHHPGYQIVTHGPVSLLAPDDWPQSRAAFTGAPLWVTRQHPGERQAAGRYPNQSHGGQGLPAFANGEPIGGDDLVVWPTIGFRHVTRPEDWPVLNTMWRGITLRPYGFFTRNPAVKR